MLKIYSIEELTKEQIQKIKEYLEHNTKKGPIDNLYWVIIPEDKLTDEQVNLLPIHGPFKIAIELTRDKARFELLIRSESLDNTGGGVLTNEQLEFITTFYNNLCEWLNIKLVKAV